MNKKEQRNQKICFCRLKLYNWLTIWGGIIILTSWIVEKGFQSKWVNEVEKLKRSQLVIDITENQRSTLEVAYLIEIQKQQKDTFLLASLQQRLARVYLDLLTWGIGRVTEDTSQYSLVIQIKRIIDVNNGVCLNKKKYTSINSNFNLVTGVFRNFYMKLDKDFSDRVSLVNSKESLGFNIFASLYILGTILLGISYIIEQCERKRNV